MVRYRCDPDQQLDSLLTIPPENPQKLDALIKAAQQRMSDTEIRRRKLTGTLASASVSCMENRSGSAGPDDSDMFRVHCNSKHFSFPECVPLDPVRGARIPFSFKVIVQLTNIWISF